MATRFRAGRRLWEPEEEQQLRDLYPHKPTAEVAASIGRSLSATYGRAQQLGLEKTAAYLASPAACRLRRDGDEHPGRATQFKKGQAPQNKGLRRPGWHRGRMKETQFKPGVRTGIAARNWRPIGTILPDAEGYLRIKVREAVHGQEPTGFGNVRVWPLLQRHVWEQARGPIPAGHAVCFKDGNRTNCAIDNLEIISRAELMQRNTVHNLPKPLAQTIQLLGALNRQIRKKEQQHADEKQDGRSQESPVRNPRGAEGRRQADGPSAGADGR